MNYRITIKILFFCMSVLYFNNSQAVAKDYSSYKHAIYLQSYPEHISHITDTSIIWHDGTEMLVSDGKEEKKTFFDKLNNPSLLDQISLPYITGFNVPLRG